MLVYQRVIVLMNGISWNSLCLSLHCHLKHHGNTDVSGRVKPIIDMNHNQELC